LKLKLTSFISNSRLAETSVHYSSIGEKTSCFQLPAPQPGYKTPCCHRFHFLTYNRENYGFIAEKFRYPKQLNFGNAAYRDHGPDAFLVLKTLTATNLSQPTILAKPISVATHFNFPEIL